MREPEDGSHDVRLRVESARTAWETGRTTCNAWRREQLEALIAMLKDNVEAIESAMHEDLGKPGLESYMTEIAAVTDEAHHAIKNLRKWTKDQRVRSALALAPSLARIHREPLGIVLIIGPWNYPIHLLLMPLVGAIAAGNAVVLKPSELAPRCSRLLAGLLPRYLDVDAIQVIEGGAGVTTNLLEQRFDHIFFTGNGDVGRIVMTAAAKHLTPVTLELGGKSPVWVDSTASLKAAADWLAWGKFANCGQTCVAPDYVLTTPDLARPLADELAKSITALYGSNPRESPDYGRIVSSRHTERLADLLTSGKVVTGGTFDVADRYVAPTVLIDVGLGDPIMGEEIFGPILPIVTVDDHHAAIEVIRARDKPLALYAFTSEAGTRADLINRTSSGGVVFDAVMVHLGVPALPFGGVGSSGMGSYHGEHSMRTFSHERAVLRKLKGPNLAAIGRPPYTLRKEQMIRR